MSARSGGFTILEVMLFLAISGLLVLVAVIGTGTTIYSTRFTDSSRSVHAYIQKQYDDILNGVNTRSGSETCSGGTVNPNPPIGAPAGTTTCLLLGKLILLKKNATSIQSYTILGSEPANPDYNKSDEALIYDFSPSVVTNTGVDTFTIPWGAAILGSKRQADSVGVDAVALIRSPRSSRIVTYVYKEPSASYSLSALINPNNSADANNFNTASNTSKFCLQSSDVFPIVSKITLTGGQGQDAATLAFNATAGECNGS